ncbi:hypothetical protein CK203_009632 [Vitis vinifera]|uniref:Uncharacterized protein n=1 Tax=Vitis vinifera TaxID=29760 RepID=A0A438JST5_VITVI|nr:hypothetical protein CK203_009632 [Vitis vinifera]
MSSNFQLLISSTITVQPPEMDTSNPAVFVNMELLRMYVGRKVRAVIQTVTNPSGLKYGPTLVTHLVLSWTDGIGEFVRGTVWPIALMQHPPSSSRPSAKVFSSEDDPLAVHEGSLAELTRAC